jgi:4-hydroxybenzoate polyprenyltransferase
MRIAGRVLPLLQLTRMALVFTAIADSSCALFLQCHAEGASPAPLRLLCTVLVSVGLYGFGMSLNDIIDRRRDALIAGHRPLPSGRISVTTAHVIAALLAFVAFAAAAAYSNFSPAGYRTLILVAFTSLLITFYDFAGKYLVAPGLLWHPLLLLNHVTVLSAVAYLWEQKRPPLTRVHWAFLAGALAAVDALVVSAVYARRSAEGSFAEVMSVTPNLLLPLVAAAAFVLLAWYVRRTSPTPRDAGQRLMLYGLLWLIVYDATFLAAYDLPFQSAAVALLLPIAYLSVRTMRWWSQLSAISHRPDFKRT